MFLNTPKLRGRGIGFSFRKKKKPFLTQQQFSPDVSNYNISASILHGAVVLVCAKNRSHYMSTDSTKCYHREIISKAKSSLYLLLIASIFTRHNISIVYDKFRISATS